MSNDEPARVAIYSIEDERAVIGSLLFDNRVMDRLGGPLAASDFYGPRNSQVFDAIAALVDRGEVADALTVRQHLATGDEDADAAMIEYLVDVMDAVPSVSNVRAYAAAVRKHAARRALIEAADEALEIAWTQPDAVGALDAITSRFGAIERQQVSRAPRAIADIAQERLAHYTALEEGTVIPGWRTGIPWLDGALNGGLRPGGLYVLAARPSVGKSSFAQWLAAFLAAAGVPTLFLSMEMGDTEIADRGVSSAGNVSYRALLTGKMSSDHWARATTAMEELGRLPLFVDDQPSLTLSQIRSKAKAVKGLKVLVVDYLQLCASTRRDGNRNSEIEEISRGLKALAKELGIAVLALSQLNRQVESRGENKRPRLSDLRDSGAVEQDADVVMFLWPVRDFTDTEGRKILGLGVDKNRAGRLGEIGLDFYGDTQNWSQSTADIRLSPVSRASGGDL
jgi:replicative DNA helicase